MRDVTRPLSAGATALLTLTAFALAVTRIDDPDTWTHLALGRAIAANGWLPRTEPLTFPSAAMPFYDTEWLFDVGLYAAAALGGLTAVIVLKAAVISLAVWILWQDARLGSPLAPGAWPRILIPLAVLLPVLNMMRHRFVERPDIGLMVFLGLAIYAVNAFVVEGRRLLLYGLPLVYAVWANTHPSVVVGVAPFAAVLGAGGVAWAARRWLGLELAGLLTRTQVGVLVVVLGACLVATLANPYGADPITLPLRLAEIPWFRAQVVELQPPVLTQNPAPYAMVALLAITFALAGRRLVVARLLLVAPFVHLGLSASRFVFLLALVGAPVLAKNLADLAARWNGARARQIAVGGALASAAAGAAMAGLALADVAPFADPRKVPGLGVNEALLPEGALRYLDRNHIEGRVLNTFHWGGYIAWRDFPRRSALVDGRGYVPPGLLEEAHFARVRPELLDRLQAAWEFDVAVVEYPLDSIDRIADPGGGEPDHGIASPAWALVYWDDVALVYLRRTERLAPIIARDHDRHLRPANGVGYVPRMLADRTVVPAVRAELARHAAGPDSELGRLLAAYVALELQAYDEALALLERVRAQRYALDAAQGRALAHWRKGDLARAVAEYRRILRVRETPWLLYNVGRAYVEMRDDRQAVAWLERARRADPNFAPVYPALIAAYQRLNETDRGLALGPTFQRAALRSRADDLVRRAAAHRQQARTAEAGAELEASLRLDPANARARSLLGWVYLDEGRLDEALREQQAALDADPGFAPAHYGLGVIYRRRGEVVMARRHYEEFIRRQPRSYAAWQAREDLARLRP